MLENNKIYQMNCLDFLRKIESNSIGMYVG